MNLSIQLNNAKKHAIDQAIMAVKDLAKQHAESWKTILISAAKEGKESTYFTEMTCHLVTQYKLKDATDLYTLAYLNTIADIYRNEGLVVSQAYAIKNINGFQARIDVQLTNGVNQCLT